MAQQKKIDLRTSPKTLPDLTKDYMLTYIEKKGKDEDKQFFIDLVNANVTKTEKGKDSFNWKVIRTEFAKRFFPSLVEEKKKEKKLTFLEKVNALKQ